MTPEERAKWCRREAASIEREEPPRDEETSTIGHCVADWLIEQANKLEQRHDD